MFENKQSEILRNNRTKYLLFVHDNRVLQCMAKSTILIADTQSFVEKS